MGYEDAIGVQQRPAFSLSWAKMIYRSPIMNPALFAGER